MSRLHADDGTHPARGAAVATASWTTAIPIEWGPLEEAFAETAREVTQYIHLPTGSVLRTIDGGLIADHTAAAIEQSGEYLRVDSVGSRSQYHWMEDFVETLEHGPLRRELTEALVGRRCFRRFKDALAPHPDQIRRWVDFRRSRLRAVISTWFDAKGLTPVPRSIGAREPDSSTPALTDRACEETRARLDELAQAFGERDLTPLIALAQFLVERTRARLTAREAAERSKGEKPPRDAESDG